MSTLRDHHAAVLPFTDIETKVLNLRDDAQEPILLENRGALTQLIRIHGWTYEFTVKVDGAILTSQDSSNEAKELMRVLGRDSESQNLVFIAQELRITSKPETP